MTDYAAMYKKIFNSQTDAIALLQQEQKETEEMYVSAPAAIGQWRLFVN